MRRLGQLLCWLLLFWQPWAVMAQAIPALDPANAFVTRWRCDAGQEVVIPLHGSYSYEWVKLDGSGQPVPGTSVKGEVTSPSYNPLRLQAPTKGEWRLLAGPEGVKSCKFSKTHSRESLLLVEKWGSVRWEGLSFSGCLNMNIAADAGVPDLSVVSDLYNLFNGCSEMTRSLADWDLSTITGSIDLSYCGMDEATYSATLVGWAAKKDQLQHGVAVSADRLHYNAAGKTARQELIDAKGWVFDGDLAPIEPLDPSHAYITRWRCDAGQEVKIPLYGRYSYEWVKLDGSGQPVASTSVKGTIKKGYLSVTAPSEGEWRLLAGPTGVERFTVPGLAMNPYVTKMLARSLILVEKWGSVRWTSMDWAYALCASMNIAADAGVPDLSKVYTLYSLFTDCKQMNRSLADWDLSTIREGITLSNCGMDEANYSATLVGWAAQKDRLQSGVEVSADGLPYNEAGKMARQELIDAKGWFFRGDLPPAAPLAPSQAFITRWRCATGQTVEVPLYGRYSYEWVKLDGSGQPMAGTSVKGVATSTKNNPLRLQAPTEGEWRLLAGPEGVNSCSFDYEHNGESLLLVEKWGSVRWENLRFPRCSNMNIAADAGVPDLSGASSLYSLFDGCK